MIRLSLFRSAAATALLFAAAFTLWAAIGGHTQGAIASGILYLVDSTGDGDLVGPSTSCDDGTGHCTLRAAIEASNLHSGADFISFNIPTTDPGYSSGTWTINLPRALPDLSDSVSINGPGANKLTVQRNTGGDYRIFNVTTSGTVSFSGLTIANGAAPSNSDGGGIQNVNAGTINVTNSALSGNSANNGGGIFNNILGTVNVTNSTLSGNSTNNSGGGIDNKGMTTVTGSTLSANLANTGGAIDNNNGHLTVTNSTLGDNSAVGSGGGIFNHGTATVTSSTLSANSAHGTGSSGGGIFNDTTVNVANSTLSGNSADGSGGGIDNSFTGTVNVTNSTLSDNSAVGSGGGVFNTGTANVTSSTLSGNSGGGGGGGIYNDATANLTSSTLSGNSASNIGGGVDNGGTANVTNCTISGNSGGSGGGIFNRGSGTVHIKSTIVALNTANSSGPDVTFTQGFSSGFMSSGFNLIGKTDGSTGFTASTDQTGTIASPLDPKFQLDSNNLPFLKDNGGPTETIALLSGSPAIDKGTSNGLTGTLTTDQRGVGYKRTINKSVANATGGDGTDIGAFEFGAKIKAISSKTHGAAGSFTVNLPLFGPKLGVECRDGGTSGVFKVILTFPSAVTVSNASVTPDPAAAGATASVSSFSVSGSKVTVNLTGVSNAQRVDVNLLGVSNGTVNNDVSVPMGVLLGDVTGDGSVAGADLTQTQSKVGQAITKSNFREDVTADGSINNTDVNLVQSQVGTSLP